VINHTAPDIGRSWRADDADALIARGAAMTYDGIVEDALVHLEPPEEPSYGAG
jgi:hypothetical protein